MRRNIDELSNLTTQKAEPPEEYFGKMDLNEEQVEKRLQYTKKANELFDVILILLLTMNERGETNFFYTKSLLESWILSLVAEFTTPDDYLMDYATDTAYNFVDTTNKHIDDPWYTSSDRALYNAENGANDVLNYTEYKEAIEAGKTEKRWITEKDNRVRKSHKAVTQKPIPILEYFRVGMAKMRFPKDYELAAAFPEELIGCRCTIEYLPKDDTPEKRQDEKEKSFGYYNNSIEVKWNNFADGKLEDKISKVENDDKIANKIVRRVNGMLTHRDNTPYEDLSYINSKNGLVKVSSHYDYYKDGESRCKPNKKMNKMLKKADSNTIIGIHNHPRSYVPSVDDIFSAYKRKYKYGLVVGHNGYIFKYSFEEGAKLNELDIPAIDSRLAKFENALYNRPGASTVESTLHALKGFGINLEVF